LIPTLQLSLNLDQNVGNEFFPVLAGLRKAGKDRARTLPIWARRSSLANAVPSGCTLSVGLWAASGGVNHGVSTNLTGHQELR